MSSINGKTKIFGIFGDPVEHSLSPVMHNAAFEHEGLNCIYLPFNISPERLGEAVNGIRGLQISGVNVTMPHKESIIKYVDELSEEARIIGAVNTIQNNNGKLIGHNTDGTGYIMSLKEQGFDCKDRTAMVFGAGGASRAISVALARSGLKKLYIANRTVKKAEAIAEIIDRNTDAVVNVIELDYNKVNVLLPEIELIVNTTSQGMHGTVSELQVMLKWQRASQGMVVSDIVYRPIMTPLLLGAKERGFKIVTGENMLLYQGVLAYELWLGKKAPVNTMNKALIEALA